MRCLRGQRQAHANSAKSNCAGRLPTLHNKTTRAPIALVAEMGSQRPGVGIPQFLSLSANTHFISPKAVKLSTPNRFFRASLQMICLLQEGLERLGMVGLECFLRASIASYMHFILQCWKRGSTTGGAELLLNAPSVSGVLQVVLPDCKA